jgi:uncharacterized protein (TIGR04255 family)
LYGYSLPATAPRVATIAHHTAVSTSPTDWTGEQLEEIHKEFPSGEQSKSLAILPFQVPEMQQQSTAPIERQSSSSYVSSDGSYETVIQPDGRQVRINGWGGIKRMPGCLD